MALRLFHPAKWPDGAVQVPKLQAHRGFWTAGFQENTLPAFRAAKAAGYRMAELDVRVSRDGEAVVHHDESMQRFGGRSEKIHQLTMNELRAIGSFPTLREVLLDPNGVDFYNVEIKSTLPTLGKVETAVARVVNELRCYDRILFSSFNPLTLALMTDRVPDVPRCLLVSDEKESGNTLLLRKMMLAPAISVHALHLRDAILTPELVSFLRAREIPFVSWTVNDKARAEQLLDAGALSVITDRVKPDEIKTFFGGAIRRVRDIHP